MKNSDLAIIGGGASAFYLASALVNSSFRVTIYEKENSLGRKLKATGNGQCNLLPPSFSSSFYNHPDFVENVLADFNDETLLNFFERLDIPLKKREGGYYPIFLNAPYFVEILENYLRKHNVELKEGFLVKDYRREKDGYFLLTDKGEEGPFSHLVIAVGGKASPKLGSDGTFFEVLREHCYSINEPLPGLAPIPVGENVSSLKGQRAEVEVTLLDKQMPFFKERGELIFRKDALSGIVIFNAERALLTKVQSKYHDVDIKIDFLDAYSSTDLSFSHHFNKALANYLLTEARKRKIDPYKYAHQVMFKMNSYPSFSDAQVTLGGLSLEEVDFSLASKREKNVYFAGEMLDIDGPCGGHNLAWALLSALKIASSLE